MGVAVGVFVGVGVGIGVFVGVGVLDGVGVGVVRIVVLERPNVVAWGSSDPAEGDPFEEDPTGPIGDPQVSRIRELLTELRASKARVVSDLSLHRSFATSGCLK